MSEDGVQTPSPPMRPRTPRWVKVFATIGSAIALLVVLMLTGVLGKGHGPGRHLGGMPGGMETSADVGGPAQASAGTRSVEVRTLDSMAFAPVAIDVSAGETVTFVVTNKGKAVHEFTLGNARMHAEHAQMMSHIPGGMSHDTPNSVILRPGETKELTWRFGDAALEFACHQPGHYDAGMRGRIAIV